MTRDRRTADGDRYFQRRRANEKVRFRFLRKKGIELRRETAEASQRLKCNFCESKCNTLKLPAVEIFKEKFKKLINNANFKGKLKRGKNRMRRDVWEFLGDGKCD